MPYALNLNPLPWICRVPYSTGPRTTPRTARGSSNLTPTWSCASRCQCARDSTRG